MNEAIESRSPQIDSPVKRLPLVGICFAALSLAYIGWSTSDQLGEYGGDNAVYLLTAQHYSPWGGPPSEVASETAANSVFPPLYPLLLAALGGAESIVIAHLITTGCLLLGFAAFFKWSKLLGVGGGTALAGALVVAIVPGVYFHALSILSENLFLLLTLGAFLFAAAHEQTGRKDLLWPVVLLVSAAALTRTAGLVLVFAFLLYLLLRRTPRWWLYASATIAAPALWGMAKPAKAGYFAVLLESYAAGGSPSLQVAMQIVALWNGWLQNFSVIGAGPLVAGIALVLGLGSAAQRAASGKLDGLYVLGYIAQVAIWPFPAEAQRLLVVLLPILIAQSLALLATLRTFSVGGQRISATATYLTILVASLIPTLAQSVARFFSAPPDIQDVRHNISWYGHDSGRSRIAAMFDLELARGMQAIPTHAPSDACIYTVKPSLVALFSGRRGRFPPPSSEPDEKFQSTIELGECEYFLMTAYASPTYRTPMYPMDRLRSRLIRLVTTSVAVGGNDLEVTVLARISRDRSQN